MKLKLDAIELNRQVYKYLGDTVFHAQALKVR